MTVSQFLRRAVFIVVCQILLDMQSVSAKESLSK